jgi:dienelactone hydrolase
MSAIHSAAISIKQESVVIDRHIGIALSGLKSDGLAIVSAELTDGIGVTWRSYAGYLVGASGAINLDEVPPAFGSFTETGTDGFFWSMVPVTKLSNSEFKESGPSPSEPGIKRGHRFGLPEFKQDEGCDVRISVSQDGQVIARATIRRCFFPPHIRQLEVRTGQIRGVLFEPESGEKHPGVIMISGSGGGIYRQDAALLAAHGFSVLALGYFNYADLPRHQLGVPLEYFEEAIQWFRNHLGHDRIGITGPSKGGEGSFVVASSLPDMIKAAAPIVPGDLYLCAVDANGIPHAAWTKNGAPLPWAGTADDWARVPEQLRVPRERTLFNARMNLEPFYAQQDVYDRAAIPVEQMKCPVLIIWGQDDQAWPSALAVERLVKRFAAKNYAYPVESYGEQGAGHFFTFPGLPTSLSDSILHSLLPIYMTMGGTPAATARMQRKGWSKLINFFREHLSE